LGRFIGFHLHKSKSLRFAGKFIGDQPNRFDGTEGFEQFAELGFRNTIGKAPHIELLGHNEFSFLIDMALFFSQA
jgi:hypothetical protein